MTRHFQQGISMIEVLISIAVMAFGFLSLASFQMRTLGDLSVSDQQFMATMLANSMGENIRANVSNINDYNNVDTESFSRDCGDPADISANGPCSVAERDLWRWKSTLEEQGMENVNGNVTIGANMATITISWDEKLQFSDSEEFNYILQVPL